MNNILLLCLLVLFSLACATTKSKNVEPTILLQNVTETPSPTTTPTPIPINDADYVVTKLVPDNIKETTLDRQPKEIIEFILQGETAKKKFGSSLKEIKVRVEDRDINYDGIDERIMFANVYRNESTPKFYVFSSENRKWSNCIFEAELGFPDGTPFELEFLAKPNKSDFDLIKISDIYGDKEVMKDIIYFQMQNGKYEGFECHKVEGAIKKVISCDSR